MPDFCSGALPEYPAASVRDYCSGALNYVVAEMGEAGKQLNLSGFDEFPKGFRP